MKKVFQVILGFVLIVIIVVVGVVMYIDFKVFNSAQAFNTYLYNNYSNVYDYRESIKDGKLLDVDNQTVDIEIKEVVIDGKKVIAAFYEVENLKVLKREIDDYLYRNAGHIKIKSYEISIPFYGGLWAQTSEGITNIIWASDNKALLIKGSSRDSVELLRDNIKSYLN